MIGFQPGFQIGFQQIASTIITGGAADRKRKQWLEWKTQKKKAKPALKPKPVANRKSTVKPPVKSKELVPLYVDNSLAAFVPPAISLQVIDHTPAIANQLIDKLRNVEEEDEDDFMMLML